MDEKRGEMDEKRGERGRDGGGLPSPTKSSPKQAPSPTKNGELEGQIGRGESKSSS
jgi:hypothetical protein